MAIGENRNIRELANQRRELLRRRLTAEDLAETKGPQSAVELRKTGNEFPLSPGQQRMWSIQQLNLSTIAYNVSVALDIEGPLRVRAFGDALRRVVRRHDILRTTYRTISGGTVRQVVDDDLPISYAEQDVRHLPEEAREKCVDEIARSVASEVFDLTADPPLRVRLIRTAEERNTLVVVAHHIAWDDGTSGVFFGELMEDYQNIASGNSSSISSTPRAQFVDVAPVDDAAPAVDVAPAFDVAPAAARDGETQHRQAGRDYWRRQLTPLPDILNLPHLDGHKEWGDEAGDEQYHAFRRETARRVKEIARNTGASSFMVLFAALSALLHRYTGARDFLIGAPVVNRDFPDSEQVMGYLGNTVALRAQVAERDTFAILIEKARNTCVEAYEHQEIELDQVVKDVDPDRRRGDSGLFNVVLSLRSPITAPFEAAGLTVSRRHLHNGSARFDLTLAAELAGDELSVAANYPAGPFADDMIGRLLSHFDTLLDAALANPDTPIAELGLLTADERHRLVTGWNDTGTDLPDALAPELFEVQARRTPDGTAVVFEGSSLSYAELDAAANRFARHLIAAGIGPEAVVALALPRSVEMIVAVLGVLKSGAAYLPIDPHHPDDRVRFMLTDSAPGLLVTTTDTAEALPEIPGLTRLVADAAPTVTVLEQYSMSTPRDADRVRPLRAHNPAYIIYTSGSTGIPKGVVVDHRALRSHLGWACRMFTGLAGRTLLHSSSSVDFAVTPMFGTLIRGGVLELCADSLDAISNTAAAATFLKITPSHAPVLPAVRFSESGSRTLVFGGEALRGAALAGWERPRAGTMEIINEYGPTEATVACLTHRIAPGADIPRGPVPIGRPVENSTCYVLDAGMRVVPVGVAGELYVGGAQLARGYLGRPGLTAARFVANPFGVAGSRLYRTGDVVRWRADGVLEFLGRVDDQVKVRGFRVEPGEIESVLTAHPAVARAAVAARDDGPGGNYLVGYVVPAGDGPTGDGTVPAALDVPALREHTASALPDYLVPAAFVVLDGLPMTPSGKTDRRRLPAPDLTAAPASRDPQTPAEQVLCELFAELLGLDRVGVDDSFFELGGDSIVSIQLVSRARAAGVVFSPRDVFEHKTVARLAAATAAAPAAAVAEKPDDGVGRLPLTPIMRSFLTRGELRDRHRMSVLLGVPAELDQDGLLRVLQSVVDQHDVLRSRLVPDDTGPVLEVRARGSVPAGSLIRRVQVAGGWDADADADYAEDAVRAELDEAAGRLDPAAGVMVQVVWFDGGPRGGRLLIVIHHLVVDGVSWRVLTQDLATAWRAVAADAEPALEPVGTSFRRWAQGLADVAGSAARDAELEVWRGVLAGPDPTLGASRLDRSVHTWATVRTVPVRVPVETTAAVLTTVPAAFYAGVNDVLLAGLGLAVAHWRRGRGRAGPSVLVTLEGHGREEQLVAGAELSRTVGWFTSQHPARLDAGGIDLDDALAGGPGAGAMVKRVKEHLRSLPDHGMGYGLLRYLNERTAADLGAFPEPQIGFNYLGRFDVAGERAPEDWALGAGGLTAAADPDMPVAAGLAVNALTEDGPDGPELIAHWMFPAGILADDEVRALAELWCTALAGLVEHTARPGAGGHTPSDLPLVSLDQARLDALESRWATS